VTPEQGSNRGQVLLAFRVLKDGGIGSKETKNQNKQTSRHRLDSNEERKGKGNPAGPRILVGSSDYSCKESLKPRQSNNC